MRHTSGTIATLIAAAVILAGCSDATLGPEPADTPTENFETLWREFDRYYALFGVKGVDWDSLHAVYRARVHDGMSNQDLYATMSELLAHLNDGHVRLQTPFGTFSADTAVDDSSASFHRGMILYRYLDGKFRMTEGGRFYYGILPEGIGYLHIPSFAGPLDRDPGVSFWVDDQDSIIAEFADLKGMVVDIRDNDGGNSYNADYIAGRFADQARIYLTIESRGGRRHHEFTPPYERFFAPRGPRQFRGPVALLTNGRSISGAEWFTLAMRELPYVTTIGDTTAGNFSGSMKRELPNGWIYTISVQKVLDRNGMSYEGMGIPPVVSVSSTQADIASLRDPVLETAIEMLKR